MNQRVLALGGALVVLVAAFAYLGLAKNKPSDAPPAATSVMVTNVTDVAFAVSWVPAKPVVGELHWGPAGANPTKVVSDQRGKDVASQTHFVIVPDLDAGHAYVFDLVNAGQMDNNGGKHYAVKTGPTLGIPGLPHVIFGKVLDGDGHTPAKGALLYLHLHSPNGQGATDSAVIAMPTGTDGSWGLDLGVRTADGAGYFRTGPDTQVVLTVQDGEAGTATMTVPIANADQPVQVVLHPGA